MERNSTGRKRHGETGIVVKHRHPINEKIKGTNPRATVSPGSTAIGRGKTHARRKDVESFAFVFKAQRAQQHRAG